MKYVFPLIMASIFTITINIIYAEATPDLIGEYSGSYTTVLSNCADASSDGSYNAILRMDISDQDGNTFSGSATGTFDLGGDTAIEYIQISGEITESGEVSGTTSHTFLGTGGEGTFTGQLNGRILSLENPGHDTYGETCTYIRNISAEKLPSEHAEDGYDDDDDDDDGGGGGGGGGCFIMSLEN
jgi:hypothetical protein